MTSSKEPVEERAEDAAAGEERPEAWARGRRARPSAERVYSAAPPVGHILVVDTDKGAAAVHAEILAVDGHQIELCSDFDEAIHRALLASIDVVIADPFVASGLGAQLIDRLREGDDGQNTRPEVVVVSARNDVDTAVAALHQGASDYLVKPVSSQRLRLAIARALERRRLLNENVRLKRDLALFAAGQRLLETLDETLLATRGLDVLCGFAETQAGALLSREGTLSHRGLLDMEVEALASLSAPGQATDRLGPSQLHHDLQRFQEALLLELGEDRFAVLLSPADVRGRAPGFSRLHEENALFLSRHLATAFKNGLRFANAEREARRDPLTGLWNAKSFGEAVQHLAIRAQIDAGVFSLVFIDVDRFKQVNDVHGHLIGSQLLVEMSQVLVGSLREGDVVARWGGDEFTILLPSADAAAGMRIGERIRSTVERHCFLEREGLSLRLTICVGVAAFPEHAELAKDLLDTADRAMYLGKGAARNAVHLAAPKVGADEPPHTPTQTS